MLVSGLAARLAGSLALKVLAGPLIASLAWGAWGEFRVRGLRADIAEARAAEAQETARRAEAIQEVTRYANQSRARDRAAADALGAAAGRLRDQVRLVLAARPPAAAGGPPAAGTGDLCTELLGEAETRLRALAAEADSRRTAGLACEAGYGALSR